MELTKAGNGRWKSGQSGNVNGRPPGRHTRHQFSAQFLPDLAGVWASEGRQTMLATARAQPETFFAGVVKGQGRERKAVPRHTLGQRIRNGEFSVKLSRQ